MSPTEPSYQLWDRAHLRDLRRCRTCGKAATKELFTGLNDPTGVYCGQHAPKALQELKDQRPPE